MSRSRPSSKGRMEPILILMTSAVRSPILMTEQIAQVHGDGLVEPVAGQTKRAGRHNAAERDDGHLRGAAADIDHHGPVGSVTGRSAPIAAAMGSSMR